MNCRQGADDPIPAGSFRFGRVWRNGSRERRIVIFLGLSRKVLSFERREDAAPAAIRVANSRDGYSVRIYFPSFLPLISPNGRPMLSLIC